MMVVTRPRLSSKRGGAVSFLLLLPLFAACAGPSGGLRKEVNSLIAARNFDAAEARIEKAKESSYGRKNQVLFYLDLGAVLHDAGRFKDSDESFDKAERRMEELYTKSVSRAAGTLILNDATTEYAGERFERAMVNAYRCLNYAYLGDRENALVEIRKLTRLLQEYSDAYGGKKTAYKDDAFAQFLSSLLYEDDGRPDDARISRERSRKAYERYASAYGTPTPSLEPVGAGDGDGELVFLHYNGVAPRKVSKTFSVAWRDAVIAVNATKDDEAQGGQAVNAIHAGLLGKAITVAFPDYVQDPFLIAGSAVESGGVRAQTELAEDLSAIAKADLAERQAVIRTRAIARAAIKFIVAKAAADEVAAKYGKDSWQHLLAQAGGAATSAATEFADTRAWATLPAQFRVARLRLPPGAHDVVVTYQGPTGAALSTQTFKDVVILKGRRTYLHDRTAL
ncbi:MAG: hypothetical protein PHS14_05735 [Elusimicrobia bacterium]|nr:hypothetical protein [Elusimicrobiota bacterium]